MAENKQWRETGYSKKLRDPRWQKMRLEILQRDGFACQKCGDETTTLHIHHRRYISGHDPWEYEGNDLVTLCETCHSEETESMAPALEKLKTVFREEGWYAGDIDGLACSLHMHNWIPQVVATVIFKFCQTEKGQKIFEAAYDLYPKCEGQPTCEAVAQ